MIQEGNVVIIATGQAGTAIQLTKDRVWVLLRNLEIWVGQKHNCRLPQDEADLAACPIEVDRFEGREASVKPVRPRTSGRFDDDL